MVYRDDRDALLARIATLEAENRRLRTELAALEQAIRSAPLTLKIREPNGKQRVVDIDVTRLTRFTFGRYPSSDYQVSDGAVFPIHAVIEKRDSGPTLLDAGTTAGTRVNGIRIGKNGRVLREGDVVQIGNTWIFVVPRFQPPSEAE